MSSTPKSARKQVRAGRKSILCLTPERIGVLTPAAAGRKSVLWMAGRLAQFANADEHLADRFRDFFPALFWRGSHDEPLDIDAGQRFNAIQCGSGGSGGIQFVSVKDWETFQETLRQAWDEHFPPDLSVWMISTLHDPADILTVWPAQRAIMFLASESWRARFCGACGKRFVADKPARRFCSPVCTGNARKSSRRAWWNRNGPNWRQVKGAQGRSKQVKSSRRSRQ